jgi:hypothetical protein
MFGLLQTSTKLEMKVHSSKEKKNEQGEETASAENGEQLRYDSRWGWGMEGR